MLWPTRICLVCPSLPYLQTAPQPERSGTPRQLTFKLNVAKAALLLSLLSREDDSARRVVEPTPLMELAAASVSGECRYRCVHCLYCCLYCLYCCLYCVHCCLYCMHCLYCCYRPQRCTVCAAILHSAA